MSHFYLPTLICNHTEYIEKNKKIFERQISLPKKYKLENFIQDESKLFNLKPSINKKCICN